ncbi:hypothetical protein FA13DRAFT_1806963 [Coprinellus micaceus]|uniref:Uncharacterized protein n=1 Tax=Coprinellus micaceus TaxID=71717 RepID=A0A4Y7RJ41_COPMI|nr:hypothetical protein FA13DRAFT_1806963 [Coprinellus micaceus]
MPKVPTARSPYRLLLPSPTGLPPHSTFYRRSSPSTPSPPCRHTLGGGGLLHEFARATDPTIPKLEAEEIVPQGSHRLALQVPSFEQEVNNVMVLEALKHEPLNLASTPIAGRNPRQATASDDVNEPEDQSATESDPERLLPGSPPRALRRGSRIRRVWDPNEVQGNRRRPRTSRARATTARQQLHSAQTEIDALKADVQRLEHSGQELKNLVSKEKGLAKDAKVEAEGSNAELRRARERLDEMRVSMDALMREFNQYRGWWLTENRSLKVVLREVPKRKWNTGLQAIASSSHSRFMSYSGLGSN